MHSWVEGQGCIVCLEGGAPVYVAFNRVWKRSEISVQVSFNVWRVERSHCHGETVIRHSHHCFLFKCVYLYSWQLSM